MKRKKILAVAEGYVGKSVDVSFITDTDIRNEEWDEILQLPIGIFVKKGNKDDWASEWWPPRKVRITIEELKEGA